MANAVVNRQVNVYINSGEAAKAYDVLIKREKVLNEELAKTTDPRRIKQLTAELDKLKDPIDRAAKKMKGELAPSIRELELATRKFLTEFKKTGDPETLRKFQAFRAELNHAKTQLNDLSNANTGLTSKGVFSGAFWGSLLAGGITAAASAMSGFFSSSIEEALAADAATSRLSNTLNNLGRSDAIDRITRKADEMAQKFRYLDNDDILGVFDKLITYGKLTEQEMTDLLPVIINFAAKSRISIDESASVIIKALEGNGKALKEYGINIKDADTETERLNVVMTTLKEKTDGAAEAFQNSAAGGIATAKQEFANLKEELGNNLIPVLSTLLGWINKIFTGLKYLGQQAFKTGKNLVEDIGSSVSGGFAGFLQGGVGGLLQGGIQGVRNNMDARQKAFQARIEAGAAQDAADNKTAEDIQNIVDAQFKRKAVLASLYQRGELTEDALKSETERVDQLVRVYTKALEIRSAADASADQTLGIDPTDPNKKDKAQPHEKVKKLETAWKEFYEMLERGRKVARDAGQDNDKLLASADKLMKAQIDAAGATGIDPANRIARFDRNRMAGLDLKVLTSRGKEKMKAELELLKEQERLELDNKNLTENEKLLIEEQYRIKRKEAENSFLNGFIDNLANYATQALGVLSIINQAQTDKENQELENNRRINDKKKNNLEQRLKKGLISQLQYDREIQKIESEQEKREKVAAIKQYRRKQQEAIFSAVINNAQGITKTIAENGFPKAIPLIVAQGIVFLAQLAAITKQKPPEFAQGGKLGGRSHSAGGNAVIDGSGRKIAEVEAGEGIVNKRTMADGRRYSVSGTPSQIISRLNGMYGSSWEAGATLIPGWRSYSPQRMNYSAMKRMYADGGVMGSNTGNQGSDNAVFENLTAMISDMQATQAYLASVLAAGIVADVSLNRFEQQQDRLTAIRRDATLRG